jgi:hypothetical protein
MTVSGDKAPKQSGNLKPRVLVNLWQENGSQLVLANTRFSQSVRELIPWRFIGIS